MREMRYSRDWHEIKTRSFKGVSVWVMPPITHLKSSPPRFTALSVEAVRDGVDIVIRASVHEGQVVEVALPAGVSVLFTNAPQPKPGAKMRARRQGATK